MGIRSAQQLLKASHRVALVLGEKKDKRTTRLEIEPVDADCFDYGKLLGQGTHGSVLLAVHKRTQKEYLRSQITASLLVCQNGAKKRGLRCVSLPKPPVSRVRYANHIANP